MSEPSAAANAVFAADIVTVVAGAGVDFVNKPMSTTPYAWRSPKVPDERELAYAALRDWLLVPASESASAIRLVLISDLGARRTTGSP